MPNRQLRLRRILNTPASAHRSFRKAVIYATGADGALAHLTPHLPANTPLIEYLHTPDSTTYQRIRQALAVQAVSQPHSSPGSVAHNCSHNFNLCWCRLCVRQEMAAQTPSFFEETRFLKQFPGRDSSWRSPSFGPFRDLDPSYTRRHAMRRHSHFTSAPLVMAQRPERCHDPRPVARGMRCTRGRSPRPAKLRRLQIRPPPRAKLAARCASAATPTHSSWTRCSTTPTWTSGC